MSSSVDTGGPAFPGAYMAYPKDGPDEGVVIAEGGMSLRDWFAGQTISAMSAELVRLASEDGSEMVSGIAPLAGGLAVISYVLADAMLVERRKP